MIITATLCIYSGRPNPQWKVKEEEYSKLLLLIQQLPAAAPQEQPSRLGYSGIKISRGEQQWYAYNGIITFSEGHKKKGYADADKQAEKKMLHTAPKKVLKDAGTMLPEDLL